MIAFEVIFVYNGLTRNPEIGNTPVCILPSIWRLEQVRDTKCGTSVSEKMLLNAVRNRNMRVGTEIFHICFCVTFDRSYQTFISEKNTEN